MHCNTLWSNSNAFSLIICKVYTKRENTDSWNSRPEKAMWRYLFCTSPNELKFYRELFLEYIINIGEKNYQRGSPRCPGTRAFLLPLARPGG